MSRFSDFVQKASAGEFSPYRYQERLAEQGLPDLLCVPTGAGKTLAAVLPWLFRRRLHAVAAVRAATARRLVLVLPQRSLVEQTHRAIGSWLDRLDEDQPPVPEGCRWNRVGLHLLLGGASIDDRGWKFDTDQDAIFVGTQDMVLSRLLLRGYGEARTAWPMSFGLLHADTQFVFDEVQLMGPALPTSLQLAGLRRALGSAAPCHSMWMSATVDPARFATPDFAGVQTRVELSEDDRSGALARRLAATRSLRQLNADPKRYGPSIADAVIAGHQNGTRTIVILNTVERAGHVYDALVKGKPAARIVLLHSRFRPQDRAAHLAGALDPPGEAGTIVVSTQVLEAGVDVSSRLMVTELAPWSSIVQRAGRCNRAGNDAGAELLWVQPPGRNAAAPYIDKDLARSADALLQLDAAAVTSTQLQQADVEEERPIHPVLRRRDLFDLFDTSADLSGNDIDVGQWIRDTDVASASVAWRPYGEAGPSADAPSIARQEICPAPLAELRQLVGSRRAWLYDQRDGEWRIATKVDVRPNALIVLDSVQGGYTVERGWSPTSTIPVPDIKEVETIPVEGVAEDPLSLASHPVTLTQHLVDVAGEVRALLDSYGPTLTLHKSQRSAAEHAGLLHDIGKAHAVFVDSLRNAGAPADGGPWAKSGGHGRLRHRRSAFRHELVSALAVLSPDSGLLAHETEPDLVAYLIAAHHGVARLAIRSVPRDEADQVLGLDRIEHIGPVELPDGRTMPRLALDRALLEIGDSGQGDSWTARACRLRDRPDLGPFRLGFLEALVRVADWRASKSGDEVQS